MAKSALITGGSRGIGLGIAEALAKQGYSLAINGVRNEDEAREQLDVLRKMTDVVYCQGNIGDLNDHKDIVSKALSHFKSIDVLVNNAGVAPKTRKDIMELDEEGYDRLMDINLKGTFFPNTAGSPADANRKKQEPGISSLHHYDNFDVSRSCIDQQGRILHVESWAEHDDQIICYTSRGC